MKYHLARGEEQLGTFNDLDVSAGLREGRFKPTDLCWTEGMKDWETLKDHLQELNPEVAAPSISEQPSITALRAEVRQDQVIRLEMASLGQRFAAKLIDFALIIVPLWVVLTMVFDQAFVEETQKLQNDPTAMVNAMQKRAEKLQASGGMKLPLASLVFDMALIVNVVLLTLRGQTIGKLCLGIQVVRFPDGARAGFIKALLLRSVLFFILVFTGLIYFGGLGLALLMADSLMIFRKDRRCLHDLVADTLVTKRKA
ncbi:MAG: RDD family protein [Prosthecobacter sp.]|uniref:RDD family protein n=1 Tax=Prosthecobacter sp. TaxID=1965333 RepID=UPI003BB0CA68